MRPGADARRTGRLKLTAIFATPFALMALAWAMYHTGIGVPRGTHNAGALIQPPVRASDLEVSGWTWVIGDDGRCDASCERWLYLSRQARIALGADAFRVSRLYHHHGALAPRAAAHLAEAHPNVAIQRAGAPLARRDGVPPAPLYLVDPNGFVTLAYCADADAASCDGAGMLRDVEFLLRHARTGQQP